MNKTRKLSHDSETTRTVEGKKEKQTIVQNKSNRPWFVCSESLGICYRSEWKVGQEDRFCLDWVLRGRAAE